MKLKIFGFLSGSNKVVRNGFLLIIPVLMLLASCHDYKPDIAKLEGEKQDLVVDNTGKDSTIEHFINEVNTIEMNLAAIDTSKRNVVVSTSNPELRKTQIVRINENIANINDLLQQNKQRIAALSAKLKASGVKVAALDKMMVTLNMQIEEKDKQIVELNNQIVSLNTTIGDQKNRIEELITKNNEMQKVVEDQKTKLNTAYYVIGTSKDLITKKVLTKEGGFIGMGKSKVLKGDYNNMGFTQIDISQTTTFPLDVKEAKLITPHPSSSYKLNYKDKKHVASLDILDQDAFWKTSKYLVVQVVNH
ncbi:MAG: hypothetical protein IPP77_03875 [Bacteroidetes bacterium]|nr:hypothetical protein [Bacteroidota bacterium]